MFIWFKAFAKKLADDRKKWLSDWMESRRRRIDEGLPEVINCFVVLRLLNI